MNINNNNPTITNIIVIDDEPTCLISVEMLLFTTNFNVVTFDNTADAIRYIKNKENVIDIILLDMMMPGISGLEFIQLLLSEHDLNKTPIIIQSGVFHDDTINKAFELGIKDFIRKPYNKTELLNCLNKIINNKGI